MRRSLKPSSVRGHRVTVETSGRDQHDQGGTLLRRWREATTRPGPNGELAEEHGESSASRGAFKVAMVGLVCLGLGIAIGYLVWGTRTMELARRVASLKETMAEHARDTIAEWTALEAKLRAAELELARLREGPQAPVTDAPAPTSPGPPTAIDTTDVDNTPSLPRVPSRNHVSPSHTPPAREHSSAGTRPSEATRSGDSAAKGSEGRPRRVPVELPRRPPDLSGPLQRPISP